LQQRDGLASPFVALLGGSIPQDNRWDDRADDSNWHRPERAGYRESADNRTGTQTLPGE
jgi:hypothetical protein